LVGNRESGWFYKKKRIDPEVNLFADASSYFSMTGLQVSASPGGRELEGGGDSPSPDLSLRERDFMPIKEVRG